MQINKRIFWVFLLWMLCSIAFANEAQKTEKFISIADIHFDPFMECEKISRPCSLIKKLQKSHYQEWSAILDKEGDQHAPHFGQDTNYFLFRSALNELKQVQTETHPHFVLILGDFLAHNFREKFRKYADDHSQKAYNEFVKKTLQFMTHEINKIFPDVDVYPAVGNNDSYTEDYSVIPNGKFLKDTQSTWLKLIKNPANREHFQRDFTKAGYYVVDLNDETQQKIIVLDTVLFSANARGNGVKRAAQHQLLWLERQLNIAKKSQQKVMIAFHIPMGINVYATLKNKFDSIWKFWQISYQKEFEKILKQYSDTVNVLLTAHIHRDTFQFLILSSVSKVPVVVTPAISPIFGNDPKIKVFSYDLPGFLLTDEDTYVYDLDSTEQASWKKDGE